MVVRGAGNAAKNSADFTLIQIQGSSVRMRSIITDPAAEMKRDLWRVNIVLAGTIRTVRNATLRDRSLVCVKICDTVSFDSEIRIPV